MARKSVCRFPSMWSWALYECHFKPQLSASESRWTSPALSIRELRKGRQMVTTAGHCVSKASQGCLLFLHCPYRAGPDCSVEAEGGNASSWMAVLISPSCPPHCHSAESMDEWYELSHHKALQWHSSGGQSASLWSHSPLPLLVGRSDKMHVALGTVPTLITPW